MSFLELHLTKHEFRKNNLISIAIDKFVLIDHLRTRNYFASSLILHNILMSFLEIFLIRQVIK